MQNVHIPIRNAMERWRPLAHTYLDYRDKTNGGANQIRQICNLGVRLSRKCRWRCRKNLGTLQDRKQNA